MNGVVSSFWLQAFVANGTFAAELWVSLCVALLHRTTTSQHDASSNLLAPWLLWRTLLAAVFIALCWQFLLRPLAGQLNTLLMAQLMQPRPDRVLLPPYGPGVLIPAYLTYAEPVVACCVMAWLSWGSLSQRPALRIARFTVLMVFLKG